MSLCVRVLYQVEKVRTVQYTTRSTRQNNERSAFCTSMFQQNINFVFRVRFPKKVQDGTVTLQRFFYTAVR